MINPVIDCFELNSLDPTSDLQPDVRIIYLDDPRSYGVFDLKNPSSTLRLILFIWNLRDVLLGATVEVEAAIPRVVQSKGDHSLMQWRADTTPDTLNAEHVTREELFSQWISVTESSEDTL